MTTHFEQARQFTQAWASVHPPHSVDRRQDETFNLTPDTWQRWCQVNGLPWPLAGVAYDIAVDHGTLRLGVMLSEIGTYGTPAERAARLIDRREQFLRAAVQALPSQRVFLKSWLRRVTAQRAWLVQQVTALRR
ncbi:MULTISPECIES: hypothetical protein [unclassified Deinococcus]|uniref:hypothetical protein n=1 Tax=unclassified Deinococcus TaxID=2623546 RepID=UPI001C2F5AB3|nr:MULTISPECIES: hypothetical protein [unclassified Deinococcus]MDK2013961.1 hypothetical protein [Deinococcus sp. 43]